MDAVKEALNNFFEVQRTKERYIESVGGDEDEPSCGYADYDEAITDYNESLADLGAALADAIHNQLYDKE
ncbi:hypothetical protein ADZZY_83 [Mycobacterium phage Adzzy]|uniref:hypothetical protein n=1 Tax=Mycobacterium phage Adzzy TaxID=1383059 RepID=UPI000387E841|nr:hypothetical protein ADZZY_83 [Mycobacterium phage Adzzy]AGT14331.1 hypothetical protein ADZZY_83 [Mycobacterium phage Adzzy]ATW60211.1 hypothetical protein SEA_PH8S_83 [Mycobacterium phage Ph8s]